VHFHPEIDILLIVWKVNGFLCWGRSIATSSGEKPMQDEKTRFSEKVSG